MPQNTAIFLHTQGSPHISQGCFCHYGPYYPEGQSHGEQNNLSNILSQNLFVSFLFPCQGRKPGSSACYASALPLSWTIRLNVFFWSLNWTSPFPQRLFICLLFSSHMMLNPLKLNFGVLNLAPWCETQYLHQHTCETHWCSSIQADQVN